MTAIETLRNSQEIYWECLKQPLIKKHRCTFVDTGIPSPWMNGVIAHDSPTPYDIESIVHYFKSKNTPFSWWSEAANEPENFKESLLKYGGEFHGAMKGMALDLSTVSLESPSLEVELIFDQKGVASFINVLIQAYEAPQEVEFSLTPFLNHAGTEFPIFHFIANKEGKPVAAGSLFIKDNIACIYHIATVPMDRKKGYATELMQAILIEAKKLRCTSSILTSTPEANNIYFRLGYEPLADFHFFTFC